jgi:excisionase family DNA binding protein
MSSSKIDVASLPLRHGLSVPVARLRETTSSSPTTESTDAASIAPRLLRVPQLSELLTIEQVARVLAVSPKTVRRLIARGFPHTRFGRVLRFDPADVHRWIVARSS